MDLLDRNQITRLAARNDAPCVSIYMPAHRAGAETQQNPIRFKNQLRDVEQRLSQNGSDEDTVRVLTRPMWTLLDDYEFWQHQSDGLAVFRTKDLFESYRLPLSFHELALVGKRLHLKPLLRLFADDGRFFVLAISQNAVRLLDCTRYVVNEVPLPDSTPGSMEKFLEVEEIEPRLQAHSAGPTGSIVYHGQGATAGEAEKERLGRYLRAVAGGVHEVLGGQRTPPLVLAGVDSHFPIFRSVSDYPNVVEQGVKGNPDGVRSEELRDRAWKIVEPLFAAARGEAVERFQEGRAHGRGSSDLKEVLAAASQGRVDVLFAAAGAQRWGTFNPDTNVIQLHETPKPDDEDLLDLAVLQTLQTGGAIHVVDPHEMPGGGLLAAVYRY